MKVTFIAHAGIAITEGGHEILIDPWFTDSTVKKPLIQPLSGFPTIDFQIPKTEDLPSNHIPDAVLVSHFHSHHAPHDDIMALSAQSEGKKKMLFGHPNIGERNTSVAQTFSVWPHVEVAPFRHEEARQVGSVTIHARAQTVPQHLAWEVRGALGSVLHIADPIFNAKHSQRVMGEIWDAYRGLSPSVMFISAGGNSLRQEKDGLRMILESCPVSPVEAAQIVAHIQPRTVSLIGCYNHSVWRNRQEYIRPAPQIEEEFHWALSWLAPHVKFVSMKPGHTYGIGERDSGTDTYIETSLR